MLLESEREAVALFKRMGREEVMLRLNELSNVASNRYMAADHIPNGWTTIDFMTSEEREERYLLLLAITLCTDPQEEARQRIIERRKNRI